MGKITSVLKRSGAVVPFTPERITNAIYRAAVAVGGRDRSTAQALCKQVVAILEEKTPEGETPSVEEIQDIVEKVLIENGHARVAKAYILYRYEHMRLREAKRLIGVKDGLKLTVNAVKVLERRYLRRDHDGGICETPGEMFQRVARAIAKVESN